MKMSLRNLLVIMWLLLKRVSCQQKVEQSPQILSVQEGETITMNCTYSNQNSQGLQWFRQDSEKGLTSLFYLVSGIKEKGRFKSMSNLKDRHSSLYISASQSGDSATYLCAVLLGANLWTFGKGTQLLVSPIINDPQPALYQLRSPKSSDISVCLFTDFDSNKSIKDAHTNSSDPTVLEMMTMESKSYGAVAWGDKSSIDCTKAFQQNMVNLTQASGSTCKVKDVKQSFETDKDLNSMNLVLIVFRVIFLKTVGFNLLMTLRLWSN